MKRRTLILSGAALAAVCGAGLLRALGPWPHDGRPQGGDAAADLFAQSFPGLDGRQQALSAWKGRPIVVNFWATWCAPCVKEMPELDALQKQYPKAQFVGIGIDSAENIRKFTQKVQVSYPLLVAGPGGIDMMRGLGNGPAALPFTMVFNDDGSIRRKVLGQIQADDLGSTLAAMLG